MSRASVELHQYEKIDIGVFRGVTLRLRAEQDDTLRAVFLGNCSTVCFDLGHRNHIMKKCSTALNDSISLFAVLMELITSTTYFCAGYCNSIRIQGVTMNWP